MVLGGTGAVYLMRDPAPPTLAPARSSGATNGSRIPFEERPIGTSTRVEVPQGGRPGGPEKGWTRFDSARPSVSLVAVRAVAASAATPARAAATTAAAIRAAAAVAAALPVAVAAAAERAAFRLELLLAHVERLVHFADRLVAL